ncbi:MAG: hypothetical protein ACOCVC_07785, partial [Spirochaeta sp.]
MYLRLNTFHIKRVRNLAIAVCILLSVGVAANEEKILYHHELTPRFPAVNGQGGAIALQSGMPSLFGNPAASVGGESGLHFVQAQGWSTVHPSALYSAWESTAGQEERMASMLMELGPEFGAGNLGGGVSAGIARTGSGLNAGLLLVSELQLSGGYPDEVSGTLGYQISGHFGWTQPLVFLGSKWSIGVQV